MSVLERMIRLREAKRAFRKKRFREALDILSTHPLAGHRDAIELRDRILQALMRRAEQALDRGDLAGARDELATACAAGHEGEDAARLLDRLVRAERERGIEHRAQQRMLSAVRRDVAAGSLAGARQKLEHLEPGDREVERWRQWVDARARDLDRYVDRCREALGRGDREAARAAAERAASLAPTNPEIKALEAEIQDLEKKQWTVCVTRAARTDAPPAAWKRYFEAVRSHPSLRSQPEFRRVRSRLLEQTRRTALAALERGEPEAAASLLGPAMAEASTDVLTLAGGVHQWVRARELASGGELRQALELFRAALERTGAVKPLRREMQAAESALSRRDQRLREVGNALESGDYQRAADRIDQAMAEGGAPAWLGALRREVGSWLDAGAAALLDVTRLVREGKTTGARLGLISLLSRNETRNQALALWKEIDQRESAAACLLGRAEAIAMDPGAGRPVLLEAGKAVEEAAEQRSDHPQAAELRGLINRRQIGCETYGQATALEVAGQLDAALACCRTGLEADPTHLALRALRETLVHRRSREIVEEAEAALSRGNADRARHLLARARGLEPLDAEITTRIQHLVARCEREARTPVGSRARPGDETRPIPPGVAPDPGHAPSRFMLRVEEGPEALVLTEETVRIGNARNAMNQIAIMANLSSSHATIQREIRFHGGVTYTLRAENGKECRVNGKRVRDAVLRDGDRIELGSDVCIRFRRPDAGSASAIVEIERGYPVDDVRRVVLMKGPGRDGRIRIGDSDRVHLRTGHADRIVEIFVDDRGAGSVPVLCVETDGGVQVDGVDHDRAAPLAIGAYVCCGPCRFQIGRAS